MPNRSGKTIIIRNKGKGDWTPETAQANPGVPVVGEGTEVFPPKKAIDRGAFVGLSGGAHPSPLGGPFANVSPGQVSVTPGANITHAPQFNNFGTAGMYSMNTASPVTGGRGTMNPVYKTNQGRVNPFGTAGMYSMNTASNTASPGQVSVTPGQGQFNNFGTAGMYSFNQNFPNYNSGNSNSGNNTPLQITAADGSTSPPVPQSSVFDPNDATSSAEWRTWWNWHAAHPQESRVLLTQIAAAQGMPDPFAVHVPTPEEVWQMKAEQRRRRIDPNLVGGGGGGFAPTGYVEPQGYGDYWQSPYVQPFGNFGNQTVAASWRIGG